MSEHFNSRVAASRGTHWVKALRDGKRAAKVNPSLLAEKRNLQGFRQIDIAARLQMSLTTYCAVERGHRLVKEFIAKHIAAELGLRVQDLFRRDSENELKYRAILRKNPVDKSLVEEPQEMKPKAKPKAKPKTKIKAKKKALPEVIVVKKKNKKVIIRKPAKTIKRKGKKNAHGKAA